MEYGVSSWKFMKRSLNFMSESWCKPWLHHTAEDSSQRPAVNSGLWKVREACESPKTKTTRKTTAWKDFDCIMINIISTYARKNSRVYTVTGCRTDQQKSFWELPKTRIRLITLLFTPPHQRSLNLDWLPSYTSVHWLPIHHSCSCILFVLFPRKQTICKPVCIKIENINKQNLHWNNNLNPGWERT